MKKILTVGLILAAVLTLGLTGCKNNADDKLPGKWTSDVETWEGEYTFWNVGKLTISDLTATWELDPNALSDSNKPGEGYYKSGWVGITKEFTYTGFKAEVTNSYKNGIYGFCFNMNGLGSEASYYEIDIQGSYYRIAQIGEEYKTIKDWSTSDALIPVGKNEITVYTEKDKIKVFFNGSEAFSFTPAAALKKGKVAVLACVTYRDTINGAPIKNVYNFKKFQY